MEFSSACSRHEFPLFVLKGPVCCEWPSGGEFAVREAQRDADRFTQQQETVFLSFQAKTTGITIIKKKKLQLTKRMILLLFVSKRKKTVFHSFKLFQ